MGEPVYQLWDETYVDEETFYNILVDCQGCSQCFNEPDQDDWDGILWIQDHLYICPTCRYTMNEWELEVAIKSVGGKHG